VLDLVHHVLVNEREPGFCGQKFIPNALNKIAHWLGCAAERNWISRLYVDGGVDWKPLLMW